MPRLDAVEPRSASAHEVLEGVRAALRAAGADALVDLSDEPVVGYRERFLLMSAALAEGAVYVAADTEVRPQAFARLTATPSLAVIGTGKRVGKTAVSGWLARRIDAARRADGGVVVLAMGRGGPPEPELIRGGDGLGPAELLAASRAGRHAASDCYEDAVLAGVTAVGCRRCGGGLAGMTFDDNVREALPLLDGRGAALAVIEGSGAVVPPILADATLCVAGASQPADYVAGFLGTYRLLLSDALMLTQCEPPFATPGEVRAVTAAAKAVKPGLEVVPTVFRPRPAQSVRGRRVAFFTTAPDGRRAAAGRFPRRGPRRRSGARLVRPRRPPPAAGCGEAGGRRGRRVPHRDQGGGRGRRRRGRRRRRPRARVLRQRAPVARRGPGCHRRPAGGARRRALRRPRRGCAVRYPWRGSVTVAEHRDIPLIDEGDSQAPFSKGLMAQTLMSTGLAPERAYNVAAAVERRLRRRGPAALTLADLQEIARDQLGPEQGDILIERFRQWQKLRRLETPLIILIGGATGVGKSTLATQLAHRLGITRLIGTDMVRQTMRAFFAPELMPAIHTSSFDAASAVRVPVPRETDLSKMGFIEQTKAVSVGIEALIQRGVDEAQRMVVEGVHLVPGYLDKSRWGEAIVLEFMLAIADKERHRSNFTVREWETGGIRPLRRYLEHFAEIRRIQKYMVGRAQALGVPVIDGPTLDDNLNEVLGMILRRVEEEGGADAPAREPPAGGDEATA